MRRKPKFELRQVVTHVKWPGEYHAISRVDINFHTKDAWYALRGVIGRYFPETDLRPLTAREKGPTK